MGMSDSDLATFRRFQRFLRAEQDGVSPRRTRRSREDDDDEEGHEQKGQAGVPPTWDGSTPFKTT